MLPACLFCCLIFIPWYSWEMQSFVLLEAKRGCEREYVSFWTTMFSFVSSHCCKVVIPSSVIGQFSARVFLYGYSSENGVPVACFLVKVPLYAKRETRMSRYRRAWIACIFSGKHWTCLRAPKSQYQCKYFKNVLSTLFSSNLLCRTTFPGG